MQQCHTLVLIKPSAVQRPMRHHHPKIRAGRLKLVRIRLDQFPPEVFAELYRARRQGIYQHLVEQMSSGKICAIVLAGPKG